MAVLLYAGIAVGVLGMPLWSAPWVPEGSPGSLLVLVLPPMALGLLVAGFLLGRRPGPENPKAGGGAPWHMTRFILGAAVTEGGAILMLGLAFIAKDSRWAILGALPAAAVLILAPVSAGDGPGN
jgi:hypothetical protein